MKYAVFLKSDKDGTWPVVLRSVDDVQIGAGSRWRFIAETDDEAEAWTLHARLQAQVEGGELL